MRRAAVICEFNPFHNGHKFLLEKIKEEYADEIICIMSGNFVQRGDIAVTDKFARTRVALENGADMVVKLPTVYAMAPAQIFASNGVRLAHELGCDCLCFGAENSIEELYKTSEILDADDTQEEIAAKMQAGCYYPRAVSESVGEPYAEIISQPNNILALEYIRACRKYDIKPIAIARTGVDHDSTDTRGNIASATKIRELILAGEKYSTYTPMIVERPASINKIEAAVLYRLKTMTTAELSMIAEVSEGLENRIAEVAAQYNSYQEILENLKTKRYTMARLRRILLCTTLNITREHQREPVPYLRVLGVRSANKHLIQSKSLPLIVDVRRGYDELYSSSKEIFNIDLRASSLMNIAADITVNEFSRGLILQ
jgi:predicted nucleotidyltransferase